MDLVDHNRSSVDDQSMSQGSQEVVSDPMKRGKRKRQEEEGRGREREGGRGSPKQERLLSKIGTSLSLLSSGRNHNLFKKLSSLVEIPVAFFRWTMWFSGVGWMWVEVVGVE